MSLYRQPGRPAARALAAAGIAALLVGGGAGYAIGHAGGGDNPTLRDAVAQLRSDLEPVRAAMELVPTEYVQAVKGGRVSAPTEYAATKADVARARAAVRAHAPDLAVVYPLAARTLDRLLAQLARAVDRRADRQEVDRLAGAVRSTLAVTFPHDGNVMNRAVVVP